MDATFVNYTDRNTNNLTAVDVTFVNYTGAAALNETNQESIEEFRMEQITERTIEEAERERLSNEHCDTDCGTECLSDSETIFKAKEICLK